MKKSSKKFAAILTLAAFVLTLVPMAAFAADPSAQRSVIATVDSDADNSNLSVEKASKEGVQVSLRVLGTDGEDNNGPLPGDLYVWASDENNAVTDALTVTSKNLTIANAKGESGSFVNTFKVEAANAKKGEFTFKFNRAGKYTIHAGVNNNGATEPSKLTMLATEKDHQVVVVKAEDRTVDKMFHDGNEMKTEAAGTAKFNQTLIGNGVASAKGVITLKDENGKAVTDKDVTFTTDSSNLVVNKKTAKSNYLGQVEFELTAKADGIYYLYAEADGYKGMLKVEVKQIGIASNIKTVKEPTAPIAKDTKDNNNKALKKNVRIEFIDAKGHVVIPKDEEVLKGTENYIKLVTKPEGASIEAKNFSVVPAGEKDQYTIKTDKALPEGKYTLRLALNNGATTEVSFEVKKFGVAKELKVKYDAETVELGGTMAAPEVVFVDANGVEKAATGVQLGYVGRAVDGFYPNGEFDVKEESEYLGSKIEVTAVAQSEGLTAKAEIVVAQDGRGLKFEQDKGVVGNNNTVDFRVVDEKGKTVTLNEDSTVIALVEKVDNADATVSATNGKVEENGEGTIVLNSNKATTATIAVYVKGNYSNKIFAGNLTYTFGKKAANADTNVVMTINSKDSIVNNKIVSIDAAPYIKMNRTFVPIRALAEDFGAKVDWNEKDQKVTVELDGNKVVMTIGSKDYTINGEKKTMDVAPEIVKDRTFVPVRFVAESLGFTVTPIYNTDGTTANVVFAK